MGVKGQYLQLHEAKVCGKGVTQVMSFKVPENHVAFINKIHIGVMDQWGSTVHYSWCQNCRGNLKVDNESIYFYRNVGDITRPEAFVKPIVAQSTIVFEFYNPTTSDRKVEILLECTDFEEPIDY